MSNQRPNGADESRRDFKPQTTPFYIGQQHPYYGYGYGYAPQEFGYFTGGFSQPHGASAGLQASAAEPALQPRGTKQSRSSNSAPKEKAQPIKWTETEEALLIELYGENKDRLRYKAYSSKDWKDVAVELSKRCSRQNVICNKTPKQCKDKLSKLTKGYKKAKDKLRSTGCGKGGSGVGDEESDNMLPKHYNEMDEIFGKRDSINSRHILESSSKDNLRDNPSDETNQTEDSEERMAEADRAAKREQQNFSKDALAMLGNILKDISKQ